MPLSDDLSSMAIWGLPEPVRLMLAYCGRPRSASFCDRFPYIGRAMRGKRSQKAARSGSPSLRRSLVRQALAAPSTPMTDFAFPPPATPSAAISGSTQRFPPDTTYEALYLLP